MPFPLCALPPGESASILSISADEALHHRLSALGFQYGKTIKVLRAGILKGPLQVAIGTTQVIIRRKDAAKITVQKTA
jgi:ferrous iron transport protein A